MAEDPNPPEGVRHDQPKGTTHYLIEVQGKRPGAPRSASGTDGQEPSDADKRTYLVICQAVMVMELNEKQSRTVDSLKAFLGDEGKAWPLPPFKMFDAFTCGPVNPHGEG